MLRILIADDHPVIRQGVKGILLEEFAPVHVDEAEDTPMLIKMALESGPWTIVVSDLAMPGGGGLLALKKIKAALPDLPVIILSTYPAEQYESAMLKAGAERFVNKDTLPLGLLQAIHSILDNK